MWSRSSPGSRRRTAFESDRADNYLASFPDHPHRGFETVTYMLAGSMLYQDHVGNQGERVAGKALRFLRVGCREALREWVALRGGRREAEIIARGDA